MTATLVPAETTVVAAVRPAGSSRFGVGTWGPPFLMFGVFVGIWYLVSALLSADTKFLLPPPHQIVRIGFLTWTNLNEELNGLWLTTQVALVGLAFAIVVGMGWAILMNQAQWVERSLFPYAVALQTIPILAMVPLIGFWFGFGFNARVIVCVLIALFPIVANTLFGLQAADAGQNDLFSLHGAGRITRLVKLQLPGAMPAIFSGFRIAAGLSVVGAVVGDYFFRQGEPGIGALISLYSSRLLGGQLFAAIILASLLGIAVFVAFGVLQRLAVGSWYNAGRGGRK